VQFFVFTYSPSHDCTYFREPALNRPQRFFYPELGECAKQGKLLAVAAKIAMVNFIERYYEDQKWRRSGRERLPLVAKLVIVEGSVVVDRAAVNAETVINE